MRFFLKFVITLWILMLCVAAIPTVLNSSVQGSNPFLLESFMKDERIMILYETDYGTKAFSMVIRNGVVVESKVGRIENPTIIVRCNSTEAEKIINSDNPILAITDAIIEGKIVDVKSSSPMFSAMVKVIELMKLIRDLF